MRYVIRVTCGGESWCVTWSGHYVATFETPGAARALLRKWRATWAVTDPPGTTYTVEKEGI